jgi:hypothetical protein
MKKSNSNKMKIRQKKARRELLYLNIQYIIY